MNSALLFRLWHVIRGRRKAQLAALLAFTLISSLAEVFSIGAVLPFMGVLTAPERVFVHQFAQPLVRWLGLTRPEDLLLPTTVLFFTAVIMAAIVRTVAIWFRTRLTFAIGADLSLEIYRRTLYQPYVVHLSRNSSDVIDGISSKVSTVIFSVLGPIIVILSNSVLVIVILVALLAYKPDLALVAFGGLSGIYLVIFLIVRARLEKNSQKIAVSSTQRVRSLQEGLGGIREVLLDNTQDVYCAEYRKADQTLRKAQAENIVAGETPRFAIEALGMLFIALLAFHLARKAEGFQIALPLVGALAIAAQRLLPLLQQIYHGFSNLSGNAQSLEDTLNLVEQPLDGRQSAKDDRLQSFDSVIECQNISFRYSDTKPWILRDLSLKIPKGARVGFVGVTGTGKSTLLDVIMGLLPPSEGNLVVDDIPITPSTAHLWQRRIAHVPQSIYLSDASIAENIAFGVPPEEIDMQRVRVAAQQAQLNTTVNSLPDGFSTLVGERGVRLSGGQRQRVGIARALYKQADVLILDEATSALDSETESSVMRAIEGLGRRLTILIVAHRVTTLRECEIVVELAGGRVSRSGSYSTIVLRHPEDVGEAGLAAQ